MAKISSLPDPILCHILSFLPVNYSVRTSVLARRWRFLWTSTRNLHFDEAYLDSKLQKVMDFSDIVYRVLLLHNGPIDSLSIRPYQETEISRCQIDAWISAAIVRNVHVLHLSDLSEPVPPCCFKCGTLVELTIERCKINVGPGAVCSPKLKKLNLLYNYYEVDECLPNLVSGCLAVEDLVIKIEAGMDCSDIVCCHVCSPTLKSLVLTCLIGYCEEHEHELVLDIPAVQYLRIDDDVSCIIRAGELSSLVVADISLSHVFYPEGEENMSPRRDPFQFLEKLSKAKSLTFRSSAFMKLSNPTFSITTSRFRNLTQLKFEADWRILTELLESAHKLEWLTIGKVPFEKPDDELLYCWRKPKRLPECLSSSLKHVYIFGFSGEDDDLKMVRYLLKHAKVLKTIKIHAVSNYNSSKLDMLRRISYFRRGSNKCRLTFVGEKKKCKPLF